MKTPLLNLISTPIPVLNSLGLDLAVGLSSEDPIGGRRPSEAFEAYLSLYGTNGDFVERVHLGELPPGRRRMFDVTAVTRARVPDGDHLVVVHRIPRRLLAGRSPDDVVELEREDADYAMYRGLVQYSYPGGSNGSVIYETPPSFNLPRPGRPPASTLTFTSKIVVGDGTDTAIALINYSVDPGYRTTARYRFAFFAPAGAQVGLGTEAVPPFTARVIRASASVPARAVDAHRDTADGLTWLTYVAYSRDTAVIPLVLTVSAARRSVSVEHTHPAQAYTLPARPEDKHVVKSRALAAWAARLEEDTRAGR